MKYTHVKQYAQRSKCYTVDILVGLNITLKSKNQSKIHKFETIKLQWYSSILQIYLDYGLNGSIIETLMNAANSFGRKYR